MSPPLIGHEAIRTRLRQAAALPASAYGFFGPEHVGKRGVAEEFARVILAIPEGSSLLAHPDAVVLDARTESGVEEVKRFLAQTHQTSAYGGKRVFIIDHVDDLNVSGMNALLKDVEEPRPGSIFLLIAGRAEALPATLRSRLVPLWHTILDAQQMGELALRVGADPAWVDSLLGRPGWLIRRAAEPTWWDRCVAHASSIDTALRRTEMGLVVAAVDEWQKAIEKMASPEQEWRVLLLLLMQKWRTAPNLVTGKALVEAWRFLETAVPARFGLELGIGEEQIFQKRGIL